MHPLTSFDDSHHEQFMAEGYLRLGHLLSPEELSAMQQRIDDIMMGARPLREYAFSTQSQNAGCQNGPHAGESGADASLPAHR